MLNWQTILCCVLLAAGPLQADDFADIAAYEAVYDLDLWENTPSSAVESVNGKTFYSLSKECDGWHLTEKYAINFLLSEGQSSEFISVYDVWESYNGDSFSFNINEESSYDGKKSYEGFANIFSGFGEANFFGDSEGSLELPSDTLFPQEHLITLLQQAETGNRVYQIHLFIGGKTEDAQYFTSTLIGNPKEIASDIDMGDLSDSTLWPFRIAYFDPQANDAEPEYEIEFLVQSNGIIRSYVVDYGDFSMRAMLESFQPKAPESC